MSEQRISNSLYVVLLIVATVGTLAAVIAYDQGVFETASTRDTIIQKPGDGEPSGKARTSAERMAFSSETAPATANLEKLSAQQAIPEEVIYQDDFDMRQLQRHVPRALEKGTVHLGLGAALGGKRPFPEDSAWNQTIDELPVDPMSAVLINSIGADKHLHPDFGAGFWDDAPIGIPYYIVSGDQAQVPIVFSLYEHESDPGPYPIPPDAHIEGDPNDGDRHVLVVDRDNWKLYELFRAFRVADGKLWRAESGAIFDLKTNAQRPEGWTSADAAGLPIFPGLARYDEVVELKEIRHALRFTVNNTRRAYVPPARHWASRSNDPRLPPLGMRVRLKQEFDISPFPPEAQVILTCLKRYGMILADNGSDWFISGAPDPRWNDEALHTLKQVYGRDLEVVLIRELITE